MEKPLVSVGMLVYNHAKYLRRAIDSILMQEVNFKYEIVIAEDCSTDKSREIIEEYYNKYPKIIKPIFQEKNIGMRLNSDSLRHNCIGIYRATLEGDDFWITTDKLQKQVEFLEKNTDFIAIGADFTCIDDNNKPCKFPWGDIKYTYCQDEEYTLKHMENWLLPGHASTMLFRNVFHTCEHKLLEEFENTMILGDRRTSLFLILQGRIKHVKEVVAVRRVLRKSGTSMTSLTSKMNWHATNFGWLIEAERFSREIFNVKLNLEVIKERRWISSLKVFFLNPSKANFLVVCEIYKKCGTKHKYMLIAVKRIFGKIVRKLEKEGIIDTSFHALKFSVNFMIKIIRNMNKLEDKQASAILHSFSK